MARSSSQPGVSFFGVIGPGLLVAATGVGAGDLLTASYAGAEVGLALLWAAWIGALCKWTLNEGVARWQMATGTTLLEGWATRLGPWILWTFLAYLLLWSFCVGGALINACGAAAAALLPLSDDAVNSKIVYGILHALAGMGLVMVGGFNWFKRVMAACIVLMVVTVLLTVIRLQPDWPAVLHGITVPTIPDMHGDLTWIIAVLGGVGGTVTLLSYGYWIHEQGRTGVSGIRTCRLDLASGYLLTGLFGMAMIVVGSRIRLDAGPLAVIQLGDELAVATGSAGKYIFLVGFWCAVFSSLLGVWQSVPYIFTDLWRFARKGTSVAAYPDLANTSPYKLYVVGLTLVPLPLLWRTVKQVQTVYAVMGALFMPTLAITLLILNNRHNWIGTQFRNGPLINALLVSTVTFFVFAAVMKIYSMAA